jgi:hypothetical protein
MILCASDGACPGHEQDLQLVSTLPVHCPVGLADAAAGKHSTCIPHVPWPASIRTASNPTGVCFRSTTSRSCTMTLVNRRYKLICACVQHDMNCRRDNMLYAFKSADCRICIVSAVSTISAIDTQVSATHLIVLRWLCPSPEART